MAARRQPKPWRVAAAAALLIAVMAASVTVSLALVTAAVTRSDHRWCGALDLLTAQPVARPADSGANPSRVEAWRLYTDFVALREGFGCQ